MSNELARKKPRRGGAVWVFAFVICALTVGPLILLAGNQYVTNGRLEKVWGRRGISRGRLQKPRAMAIDAADNLYIVDMTARIQVFDRNGNFQRQWQTPASKNGRPTGLSFDKEGHLAVADTHYYRVLFYSIDGVLLEDRTLGGTFGHGPGEFGLVTDVVQDSQGNYYVAEYGEYDRIQKFSPDGAFLLQWGGHGNEIGQFVRPQNLAIDENDQVWVADACNHRIQVFDATGDEVRLVRCWGREGSELGDLRYPYDLVLDGRGHVYICEYGNHRVQKFTTEGRSLGAWGINGRDEGELYNPWALVQDSKGRIHILDTYNHRVQRIRM